MCHDVASRPICHVVEEKEEKEEKGRSLSKGCGTILTHRDGRGRVSGCVLEILYYVQPPPSHSYIFCALKYPQT